MTLAKKGTLTLNAIVQISKVPVRQVKECLLVLMHHNMLYYHQHLPPNSGSNDEMVIVYRLSISAIIIRLAYPLLLANFHGNQFLFDVVKNGRMSLGDKDDDAECVALINEGYLEYCTSSSNLWIDHDNKNNPPANSVTSTTQQQQQGSPTTKKIKTKSVIGGGATSFVRLNNEAIIEMIKRKMIIKCTGKRINSTAASLMAVVLDCGTVKDGGGGKVSTFQINNKMNEMNLSPLLLVDGDGKCSKSPLVQYLNVMCDNLDFFIPDPSGRSDCYSINNEKANLRIKMTLVESFINQRFGSTSTRIFRIIGAHKMVEEKTISKIAMIPAKDTRDRLYQLLKLGLVILQPVSKSLDHAAARTIHLWSLEPNQTIFTAFSTLCLKGLVNLLEREAFELDKNSLLIKKSERSDVLVDPSLLGESEHLQLAKLDKIRFRITLNVLCVVEEYLVCVK